MSTKFVMSLDFGTGAGRCFLFDLSGNIIASSYSEWSYNQPSDAQSGGFEFDANLFWLILCQAIQECISKSNISLLSKLCTLFISSVSRSLSISLVVSSFFVSSLAIDILTSLKAWFKALSSC